MFGHSLGSHHDAQKDSDSDKHRLLLEELVAAASNYVSAHGNADGSDREYADLQLAVVNWNIHHSPMKGIRIR